MAGYPGKRDVPRCLPNRRRRATSAIQRALPTIRATSRLLVLRMLFHGCPSDVLCNPAPGGSLTCVWPEIHHKRTHCCAGRPGQGPAPPPSHDGNAHLPGVQQLRPFSDPAKHQRAVVAGGAAAEADAVLPGGHGRTVFVRGEQEHSAGIAQGAKVNWSGWSG